MLRAYLIRHCAATGQEPQAPLTAEGLQQALWLAEVLKGCGIKRILSSTFERALQSASPLAMACGLTVESDSRLCERALGEIADGNWLKALALSYEQPLLRYPSGETTQEATARARGILGEVLSSETDPVAFFTHGNLLSLIARSFDPQLGFDFWKSLRNPDIFELHEEEGVFQLQRSERGGQGANLAVRSQDLCRS